MDLFADDAQVFFPKWGLATGKQQIGQLFTDFGAEPVTSTPEELGKFISSEVLRWREIIRKGNITAE